MGHVVHIERIGAGAANSTEARNAALVRKIFTGFSVAEFNHLYENMNDPTAVTVIGLDFKRLGKWAQDPNFVPKVFSNGMTFEILESAVDGDTVFVEWHDSAETSTGKTYENDGLSVFKFDNQGKIDSYHEYFDPEKFYEVL